ncbi:MAG: peptidyl-prolyl cis-trans isomerase [Acidobacteria bacterium]|nr:peptidyl-prolyl cis-trans isomerase [Acidobacteriota bacterium]
MKRQLSIGMLGLSLLVWHCSKPNPAASTTEDRPLLKIADLAPNQAEFQFYFEKGYPELAGQDDPEMMSYVFDQFVQAEKIYGYALAMGMRVVDDQVDAFINEQMTHITFNLMDPSEQTLWRNEIRRRLTIQKFLQREIIQNVTITDEAIEKHFLEHQEDFQVPEKFRFRSLKCQTDDQAKGFINEFKASKKTFLEVAPQFAEHEGYLMASTLSADEVPKPFGEALKRLQPGQISGVIPLEFGEITTYHVLYLESVIPALEVGVDEVYDQIKTDLEKVEARNLLHAKLEELDRVIPMTLYPENLNFNYIPEDKRSGQP